MSNAATSLRKEKILAILDQLETKGDAKNTLFEALKSLAIGVAGAAVGAAIGKPSIAVGFGTTLIGHYIGQPRLASLGVGMIASGGYQVGSGTSTTAPAKPVSGMDGVQERIKAFGANIKQQLYLDKIIKPKAKATNGLGAVQYFNYPNTNNDLDMGSLNALEDEINLSGEDYEPEVSGSIFDDDPNAQQNQVSGAIFDDEKDEEPVNY